MKKGHFSRLFYNSTSWVVHCENEQFDGKKLLNVWHKKNGFAEFYSHNFLVKISWKQRFY